VLFSFSLLVLPVCCRLVHGVVLIGGAVTVCCVVFIFVADFAGLLPVGAVGGVWVKWLIISVFLGLMLVIVIAGLISDWCCCERVLCSFLFRFKKKRTKRKGNFLSIAPLTKK